MLNQALIAEINHEASSTRKMLERVPQEKFDWKPHEKSMSLGRLATHVAELPNWMTRTLTTEEFDFSKHQYKPNIAESQEHLLQIFDTNLQKALQILENTSDDSLRAPWTLRNGERVFFTLPRIATLRSMSLNHLIHHRGQLSVYLRLLNVPIPGMYGPSADEMAMFQ
ncbi:MAG: hypothetical protein ICV66_09635 [Chitinophagaceae bacterium]|nr:hypothetical protein [Chitinophagaceae bacterium]